MTNGNPFYVDPTAGYDPRALSGLADTLKEGRERKTAQAAKVQSQTEVQEAIGSGDPAKIQAVMVKYPEMAAAAKSAYGISNTETEKLTNELTSQLAYAETPEEAADLIDSYLKPMSDMGGMPMNLAVAAKGMRDGTETLEHVKGVGMLLNPEIGKEQRAAAGEIRAEEELNIKKLDAQTKRDGLANDRDMKRLALETNELKKQELKVKIDARKEKIISGKKDIEDAKVAEINTIDRSLGTADELLNHPGLNAAVGGTSFFPTVPGSEASDFEAILEAFDAQNFMAGVKQMKGMGALSEAEGRKISAAMGALKLGMSEGAFRKSLTSIRDTLQEARNRGTGDKGDSGESVAPSIDDLVNKYSQPLK